MGKTESKPTPKPLEALKTCLEHFNSTDAEYDRTGRRVDLTGIRDFTRAVIAKAMREEKALRASSAVKSVRFVGAVASLLKDGEKDEEGKEFDLRPDDAIDTLETLISDARKITEVTA